MRPRFHHLTILQHQDLVAVKDRTETVRHKYTGPTLLFQYAVDILQQSLFGVGVKSRGLFFISQCLHNP